MAVKTMRAYLGAARMQLDLAARDFAETPARHRYPEVVVLAAEIDAVRAQLAALQAKAKEAQKSVLRREGRSETIIARVK